MADLGTSIIAMPAGTVSAFGVIIHDLLGSDMAKFIIFLVFIIVLVFLRQNTNVTKSNTVESLSTRDALASHTTAMKEIQGQVFKKVDDLSSDLNRTKLDIVVQTTEIKKAVGNLSLETNKKLSMIPKIQDALSAVTSKTESNETKLNTLIDGLERFKNKKDGSKT